MISVRLPDGSIKQFDQIPTIMQVAESIGPGLAKAAVAGRVGLGADAKLVDVTYPIEQDADVSIVTTRDQEGLDIIRHSTAHLMAYAVKELFPKAEVTIGPTIENGFYYDFSYERPFAPEDLEAIEAKMHELAEKDEVVTRKIMPREEAIAYFKSIGEEYKAEIIDSIPAGEDVSLYTEGAFTDLCRGPHVPRTGLLKHFKLTSVAGAYWRGDSNNEQLQRIYGTAWSSKKELSDYLHMLEEAERRDHRKLGRELDLFHIDPAAPGVVFWHENGWLMWQEVEQYLRKVYHDNGYREVKGPQLLDQSLWEKTGHWDKYRDNMFITESEKRKFALKPMNCPGHLLIFNQGIKSYRDLPYRMGEFGSCHRNEPSGSLHGIMRVRGFTQDDGHILCTEEQLMDECVAFNTQLAKVYKDFGFEEIIFKVATRPEQRIGSDELWDKAEEALCESLKRSGHPFVVTAGEGAFYGPKIEYTLKDAIGRQWQCGTIQVDFNMPERLGAVYITEDGERKPPVMLHRAIVGSLERFIGILIENHAGAMPAWLAPHQVRVLNITDAQAEYAQSVVKALQEKGFRVQSDLRNEKVDYKIREATMQKLPYIIVVGGKEVAEQTVTVRKRGNENLGAMPLADFIERLEDDVKNKRS